VKDMEVPFVLPARSHKTFSFEHRADGGMGVKTIGPMSIEVTDPFGIFEFSVVYDETIEVEVVPKVEEVPNIRFRGSPHSHRYGIYDVHTKGVSVNFVGVREYHRGDSLKNVAWRLSAKRDELYVKEFENMVNAEISVFMNLNPRIHQGAPGQSTWELTKDAALSLVSEQIANANSVRVFTQQFYIENLNGVQDTYELAQQLLRIDPLKDYLEASGGQKGAARTHTSSELIEKYIALQRSGSNVVLITPFVTHESAALLNSLKGLKEMGCEVYVVLVDSQQFYGALSSRFENTVKFATPTMTGIEGFSDQLTMIGVHVAILDSDQPIADSFLRLKAAL
ncbi:MAG: DUF58 domain-containing protein, partial [Pseudomonadota bacterium]